jgi:RNA-directed DNA polymerase
VRATERASSDPTPTKRANKAGQPAAAESVEGRGSTKGNVLAVGRAPDAEPGQRVDRLEGVRQAARRDKKARFTALLHHLTPKLLWDSFQRLKREASPGVDGVTWQEYGDDGLLGRIDDLHARVHRGTYRAKPSKRAWIPKADGRQRPWRTKSSSKRSRPCSNTSTRKTLSATATGFGLVVTRTTHWMRCG